jgi:hypothetical protein
MTELVHALADLLREIEGPRALVGPAQPGVRMVVDRVGHAGSLPGGGARRDSAGSHRLPGVAPEAIPRLTSGLGPPTGGARAP